MLRPPLRWVAEANADALARFSSVYAAVLRRASPASAAALDGLGAPPGLYLLSWLATLFAKPLGLEAGVHLWDRCLLGGLPEVLRCAVGLTHHLLSRALAAQQAAAAEAAKDARDRGIVHSNSHAELTFEVAMKLLANPPKALRNGPALAAAVEEVKLTSAELALLAPFT
jgi:hypothetical protein